MWICGYVDISQLISDILMRWYYKLLKVSILENVNKVMNV